MPQAVTHILFPILLMSFFRDFYLKKKDKKKFPLHYIMLAGLGGVLPDIDIPISIVLNFLGFQNWWIHRTFSHSIFFPICFLLLAAITMPLHKHLKICTKRGHTILPSVIFLMLAFGIVTHIFLDGLVGESLYLLYPFSPHDFGINLLFSNIPKSLGSVIMPTLDGVLLVLWLIYLEVRHKISDFI